MGLDSEIKNSDFSQKQLRYLKNLISRIKVGFDNLTNSQAKQIANAIGNITGGFIRIYRYNNGNGIVPSVPLLINNTETIVLRSTNSTEAKFYLNSEYPLQIKTKEDMNLNLPNGKYLRIYTQVDNIYGVGKLFKNITKDTLIGNFAVDAYFQVGIENYGNDLIQAQPYNITIENNTSVLPKIRMEAQNAGLSDEVATNGKVLTVIPFQNWDYTYPYWGGLDMTNQSQGIKLQLFTNDGNNNLLGTGYAYAGNNYSNTNNWIGQIQNGYGTRNFKIVISNI
jgi:hypothetical protein